MDDVAIVARWFIAVPAGLLFALCVVGNWSLLLGVLLGRIKSASLVLPFLGPLFGLVFLIALPVPGAVGLWWVASLAEPTWWLGLLGLIAAGIGRLHRGGDA